MTEQELLEELALLEALNNTPDYIGGIKIVSCSAPVGITQYNSDSPYEYGSPVEPTTGEILSESFDQLEQKHDRVIRIVDIWNDVDYSSPEEEKAAHEARQKTAYAPIRPIKDEEEILHDYIEVEPDQLPGETEQPEPKRPKPPTARRRFFRADIEKPKSRIDNRDPYNKERS